MPHMRKPKHLAGHAVAERKVAALTPLNNMIFQSCPLQNKFLKCFLLSAPKMFSDSKT